MLRLSGKRLCCVVLLAALAVAMRAIPRVLNESSGTSNDATAVFTLDQTAPTPRLRLAPRKANCLSLICLHSNDLELFPMFSGMLQRRAGRDRLRLLGAQRE
jgi:hypothetical protein